MIILPKLVAGLALVSTSGVTLGQFAMSCSRPRSRSSILIMEARANDLLFMGEDDDNDAYSPLGAGHPLTHMPPCRSIAYAAWPV